MLLPAMTARCAPHLKHVSMKAICCLVLLRLHASYLMHVVVVVAGGICMDFNSSTTK